MISIPNFVETATVSASILKTDEFGPLVGLNHHGGSVSFNHFMKPDQAIRLADSLLELATQVQPTAINAGPVKARVPNPKAYAQEMLDLLAAIVIEGDGENAANLRSQAFDLTQKAEGWV